MKKNLRVIIVVVICAALCLSYYYYLTNRDKGEENLTEVEMVITKNLDKSYPKTAREVVKFYFRIQKCYQNEEITEEELKKLTEQARKLMDEDLQEQNPEDAYLTSVKQDIKENQEKGKNLSSITVENSNEIDFHKVEGRECAYVDVYYFVKESDKASRTAQTYILRKNESGKWKILAFYQ